MIEQRVTLRYDAQQIPAIVQAVQGDTGRDVIFELADYEIPAGATANYYIDKPDGNAVYNSAEVISSTEILAHLTEQALAAPGRNNGQVRILSDDEVITSFDFVLEVEAFRGILRLQSETEVNIFDQAIDEALTTATAEAVEEIQAQTPAVTGMQNSIAPTYSSSSTYAVGDYVMYNAQLYRCITTITTAEAWTAAHWSQVPLANDVRVIKNAVNDLSDINGIEWISGHYIDSQGIIRDYAPFSITDYIPLSKNGVRLDIYFTVYGNTATHCAFYDKNKSLISVIQTGAELNSSTNGVAGVEYVRLTNSNSKTASVKVGNLRNITIDAGEELKKFENAVFPDFGKITYDNNFFFSEGMFYVSRQTATITGEDPLTINAAASSAIKLVEAYLLDSSESKICLEIEERSRLSANASLIFYNSAGTYISQEDVSFSDGYAFISVDIPVNARAWSLLFNFYNTGLYEFSYINVYYGAERIIEKEFQDVIYKTYGTLAKKWCAVGDSLTAYGTLGALDNYVNYVSKSLGLDSINLGWGGSGYMSDSGANKAFWQRYNEIPADTDVLTIFGSLNDLDLAYNNIGTLDDSGTSTLYGCMNTFFNGIYSVNVGMRVGIILPTPWQWMNRRYPGEITTLKTESYINALIEFAKWNSIPILNLFDEGGLRPWNSDFRTEYYKEADGTHPNSLGHYRFIYPKVKSFIQRLISE